MNISEADWKTYKRIRDQAQDRYSQRVLDDADHLCRNGSMPVQDRYAELSRMVRDPAEVLGREDLSALGTPGDGRRIAFHAPCSLQHGQQLPNVVEPILTRLGFVLTGVPDAHFCCGSAGTYSLTQPPLAERLRANKAMNGGDVSERGNG